MATGVDPVPVDVDDGVPLDADEAADDGAVGLAVESGRTRRAAVAAAAAAAAANSPALLLFTTNRSRCLLRCDSSKSVADVTDGR